MYLQGVSTCGMAAITVLRPQGELWLGLSRIRISKDAVSRIAQRLEEGLSAWRGPTHEVCYALPLHFTPPFLPNLPCLTWTPATSR